MSSLQIEITPEERKLARQPHEIFLINLIFNHIFMMCAALAVYSTFNFVPLLIPIISFSIIAFLFIKGRKIANSSNSWYVKSHWQIALKRNRLFSFQLLFTCAVAIAGLALSQALGWHRIPTIALIAGVGLLPFMVSLLILVILGNESVYMARDGKLPKRFEEKMPPGLNVVSQA